MPWWGWLIATLAPTLFGAVSGNKGKSTQEQVTNTSTTQPATGYSSPMLPMMDLGLTQMLGSRYGSLAGAGMPGGQAPAGTNDMMSAIMSMIGGELPGLLDYYKRPQAGVVPATNTRNIWSA